MMSVCKNLTMVYVSASSVATASVYFVKKSTASMMYLFPVRVTGSGPITSIPMCSNGSYGIFADDASGVSLFFFRF